MIRDRTPMQWNNGTNGGFNTGTKPWLPMGNFREINVEHQNAANSSHLKVFKKLVQLHKTPAFRDGLYESADIDDNIYSYVRSYNDESYLVALNFAKQNKTVNFARFFRSLDPHADVVVASLNSHIKEE